MKCDAWNGMEVVLMDGREEEEEDGIICGVTKDNRQTLASCM